MTSDNQPDELPTKGPEVSALRTRDDAIWSPNFACAHLAKTQDKLRQELIEAFPEVAEGAVEILADGEERWYAWYQREGYDGPVYWTGTKPSPLPS